MLMGGAVQNGSRPMLSCQEMSQVPPNAPDITATIELQIYQGTDGARTAARSAMRSWTGRTRGMVCAIARTPNEIRESSGSPWQVSLHWRASFVNGCGEGG